MITPCKSKILILEFEYLVILINPSDQCNLNKIDSIALQRSKEKKFALPLINDNLIMMRMGR